jgi:hypothetical protein
MVNAPAPPVELADCISLVAVTAQRVFDDGEVTVIEESDPQADDAQRQAMKAVR